MKTLAQTAAACLLTLCIAGLARSQEPLSQSANLAPFPESARTNEWSFTLEPNQMATYTVGIASSGTAPAPDNRVYNFQSSSYAVLPPTNINTIWVWTVSGSGQNYVCDVANTHWQEAETIVTISCTWASVQGGGSGGSGSGQPPDLIHGEAKGIALHKWGQLVATSDIAIEGAPEYLCVNETITLRSWLVTNDFPFVNPVPITSDWEVESVGTNGGNGQFQPTTGDEVLFIPTSPGHVRVTATESQYGVNSGAVEFIIYEVQSITAIPMGAAGYQYLLPDPVWIGAGGLDSDAHKADVTINVLPPVADIPIEVRLERGIGHANSARLEMGDQTAVGGMDSVEVLTGPGGAVSGTLTSSDASDTCTIHACQKQTNIVFNWVTQFDPETDWELEPGYLPVPGVLTNRVLFRHHRAPSSNAPWKPFYNHQIRFFVEKVEWIDTNGVLQVIVNTPDIPSTNVNEWAIFDSPNTTDADGWVTAKLTVFDRPELYRVTMVAYDWNVWSDPPAEPQPMGVMTLMSQPPVDERTKREFQTTESQFPTITIEPLAWNPPRYSYYGWDDKSQNHNNYKQLYGEKPWVSVGMTPITWMGQIIQANQTFVRYTVDPPEEFGNIQVVPPNNATIDVVPEGNGVARMRIGGQSIGHGDITFHVGDPNGPIVATLGVAVYDVVMPNTRYFIVSATSSTNLTRPYNVSESINADIGDRWRQALAWPQQIGDVEECVIAYDLGSPLNYALDYTGTWAADEQTALLNGLLAYRGLTARDQCDALWIVFVRNISCSSGSPPLGFYMPDKRIGVVRSQPLLCDAIRLLRMSGATVLCNPRMINIMYHCIIQ